MRRRPAISLRVGLMYYPRKRSGSMPAEQARPRRTRGGIDIHRAMRIITAILDKLLMWGSTVPTPGAFLICTAMCGSGRRTGTQHTVREHRPILRVQPRAPTVSFGAAPGAIPARTCVRPTAPAHPSTAHQHRLPCRFPTAVCRCG